MRTRNYLTYSWVYLFIAYVLHPLFSIQRLLRAEIPCVYSLPGIAPDVMTIIGGWKIAIITKVART